MLEALYGELDSADRMALDQHIAACSECAAELAGLERTRQAMDIRKQAPPSEETLENVWPEFLNRLGQSESPRAGILHWTTRRWALNLAAAAALVAIGVIIGRYGSLAPRPDSTGPGVKESPAVAASTLDDRVARYLERSKLVLMSVDNMKPGAGDATALDLGPERRLSKDLLRESRALEKELQASREDQLLELISQLEVTLLQIANMRDARVPLGVELAKTGIEERALLFKINLEEMRRASERIAKSKRERESAKRRIG
jgi:hypothetical protein